MLSSLSRRQRPRGSPRHAVADARLSLRSVSTRLPLVRVWRAFLTLCQSTPRVISDPTHDRAMAPNHDRDDEEELEAAGMRSGPSSVAKRVTSTVLQVETERGEIRTSAYS